MLMTDPFHLLLLKSKPGISPSFYSSYALRQFLVFQKLINCQANRLLHRSLHG